MAILLRLHSNKGLGLLNLDQIDRPHGRFKFQSMVLCHQERNFHLFRVVCQYLFIDNSMQTAAEAMLKKHIRDRSKCIHVGNFA